MEATLPSTNLVQAGWTAVSYFVQFVVFVVLLIVVWRGNKNQVPGTSLVLKRFNVDTNPGADRPIEIVGRGSGLLSWLLGLLRIAPDFEFQLTNGEVYVQTANLAGIRKFYVPLASVASTECGYQRSLLAFAFCVYFGVGFVLNSIGAILVLGEEASKMYVAGAIGSILISGIAAAFFALSKRIAVSVETSGGRVRGLAFKRSIIENISVDLPEALSAIRVINRHVLRAQEPWNANGSQLSPLPRDESVAGNNAKRCSKCNSANRSTSAFCEDCGTPLQR